MKLKGCVFILFVFVLLTGLAPAVLAQDGDPESDYLIFLPVVMLNSPGVIDPPDGIPPLVISLDGSSVDAGADLRVRLEYHQANRYYDVYLYSTLLDYVAICLDLQTDAFGSVSQATCQVPADTTPGSYQLVTIEAGGDTDPANHVAEGDFVDVLYPGQPLLTIADGNRWPPGSTITFQLYGHQPCPPEKSPCPPFQEYDIALIGGAFPSPGGTIPPPVRVDEFGSASKTWTIPFTLAPGSYTVVTYQSDTTEPVIASTVLEVVPADVIPPLVISLDGSSVDAGADLRVRLEYHQANRSYDVYLYSASLGYVAICQGVDVGAFGTADATCHVPAGTTPGYYQLVSILINSETDPANHVGEGDFVEVLYPGDPLLTIADRSSWPPGSTITFE